MPNLDPLETRPWLKSYDAEVPHHLDYEEMPLFEFLDRAAANYPDRIAIHFRNWKITYAKLQTMTNAVAANLRAHGVSPGDRISIMLPNLPQTIISFWGALKAGAVVTMTNPLYMEKELVHQVADSGAKFMIVLDHLWPKIEKLRDKLAISKYFITRVSDCLGFPLNLLYSYKAKRDGLPREAPYDSLHVFPWKPLLKKKKFLPLKAINPRRDLALLQYTGGTTGISKGVMLTHFNLVANVQQCRTMLHALRKDGGQESMMGLLPYFHVYGLTICLLLGTSIAAKHIPYPRFSPKDILESIHKLRPTIFPGAPSIYLSLIQQKDVGNYDLSSIRYCVSGSAPMPVEGMKRFKELTNAEIIEGYGLTEASPVTHLNPITKPRKPGAIGLPFPDTEARLVDMVLGDLNMPAGRFGELLIRGPQVMKGYWNRPDETANALRNGWLYTGDVAIMDEDGYFSIVDRKKDMILIGGYNVYPREIDEVLMEHPKVLEAVAIGIPHPTRGETIKAYVVVKPGETLDKGELLGYCRQKLANYKIPKQVEFRDQLPKTVVGKVLRRELRVEEEEKMKPVSTLEQPAPNAQD